MTDKLTHFKSDQARSLAAGTTVERSGRLFGAVCLRDGIKRCLNTHDDSVCACVTVYDDDEAALSA